MSRDDVNATGEFKYVLAGQPTGWSAMAKAVRDFDEEKVRDCKEDIDTLLVFAGLFSAVLSAFLIVSYPALQPDPSDRIALVLDRIAAQTAGYTVNSTVLQATTTLNNTRSTFEPSLNDIRVNVFWFASLIISLVTASFGMLVKQWLREFLAVDVPSPQARLRIRHFRAPDIAKWKVFEIAAALPLLLQLALGLFFVGLCYFTSAIHSSVKYTTLPLVVGWAFCFFTFTFLPIFFPRCPYKTTLLKGAVRRPWQLLYKVSYKVVDMLLWRRGHWSTTLVRRMGNLARHIQSVDEARVTMSANGDMRILAAADAIQSNDELLRTAILESVTQLQPMWTETVELVMRVLENRLQWTPSQDIHTWRISIVDLHPLSREARASILDMLSNTVKQLDVKNLTLYDFRVLTPYIFVCAVFLSISTQEPLPKHALDYMNAAFHAQGPNICRVLTQDNHHLFILFKGLHRLMNVLTLDFDRLMLCFDAVVDTQLARHDSRLPSSSHISHGPQLWPGIKNPRLFMPWPQFLVGEYDRVDATKFLLEAVRLAFKKSRGQQTVLPMGIPEAIMTAIHIYKHCTPYRSRGVGWKYWEMCGEALLDQEATSTLIDALLSVQTAIVENSYGKQCFGPEQVQNLTAVVDDLLAHPDSSLVLVLKLTSICIRMADDPQVMDVPGPWQDLFRSLAAHITVLLNSETVEFCVDSDIHFWRDGESVGGPFCASCASSNLETIRNRALRFGVRKGNVVVGPEPTNPYPPELVEVLQQVLDKKGHLLSPKPSRADAEGGFADV